MEHSLVSKSKSLVEQVDVEAEVWARLWEQKVEKKNVQKRNLNQWPHVDSKAHTNNKMRNNTVWLTNILLTLTYQEIFVKN